MGSDVRSNQLTVLCRGCGNPVEGSAMCLTCGDNSRASGTRLGADELDEALVDQVGAALAAQVELATHTAAARIERTAGLLGDSLALRGRLRRQRALLRKRVAERGEQARDLSAALARVDEALQATGRLVFSDSDWSFRARLPRDKTCPMVARRLVEGHVREDLDDRQSESATLIVSELATNALVHGAGTIVLVVIRDRDRLRIEVSDEGHSPAIGIVSDREHGIGGRGLFIVDQLASGWGAAAGTGHVWAELDLV